ncbi:exopolysaccharide biosynthesis protein [Luteimonas suaedae]|uniref:exopolysaccharide biosynthesis protein n=1 Tax=Luteimonas suaedae TaxID=2605430 RepID=UPI002107E8AE|nr:exopolysaccharide biosynthesis protein [Luteimonas suaedae]
MMPSDTPPPRHRAGDAEADGRRHRRRGPREAGIRALLAAYAVGDPDDVLTLRILLSGLGKRMFGMLLLIAALPAFIPIPIGGAISGPLTILIGLQLLLGLRRPWLPQWIARRGPRRHTLLRFERKVEPWLIRLEHLIKPRLTILLDQRVAILLTGVLLVVLGVLLALPIPFTNYLFGGLMLLYALALLERDGVLMLVAWTAGIAAIAVFGVLSGALATTAMQWIDALF